MIIIEKGLAAMTSPRKKTRIVLCIGVYCNLDRRADRLYRRLAPQIDALNGDSWSPCLKLERANCLSLCAVGPNLIIYLADGTALTFNQLDEAGLDALIAAHLSSGNV